MTPGWQLQQKVPHASSLVGSRSSEICWRGEEEEVSNGGKRGAEGAGSQGERARRSRRGSVLRLHDSLGRNWPDSCPPSLAQPWEEGLSSAVQPSSKGMWWGWERGRKRAPQRRGSSLWEWREKTVQGVKEKPCQKRWGEMLQGDAYRCFNAPLPCHMMHV